MQAEARAHLLAVWVVGEARRSRPTAEPLPESVGPEGSHATAEVRVPRQVERPPLDESLGSTAAACSSLEGPSATGMGGDHELSVCSERSPDAVAVEVGGEVDAATAPDLSEHLIALEGMGVVVGLGGVKFMDSNGPVVLVSALQEARAAGRHLVLRSPSRIFELWGTHRLLDHQPMGQTAGRGLAGPRFPG